MNCHVEAQVTTFSVETTLWFTNEQQLGDVCGFIQRQPCRECKLRHWFDIFSDRRHWFYFTQFKPHVVVKIVGATGRRGRRGNDFCAITKMQRRNLGFKGDATLARKTGLTENEKNEVCS